MGGFEGGDVEVDFSGFPIFGDLGEESGDEAEERGFVGEDAGDAGAAFEFLVDPFEGVGGAEALLVSDREGEMIVCR